MENLNSEQLWLYIGLVVLAYTTVCVILGAYFVASDEVEGTRKDGTIGVVVIVMTWPIWVGLAVVIIPMWYLFKHSKAFFLARLSKSEKKKSV